MPRNAVARVVNFCCSSARLSCAASQATLQQTRIAAPIRVARENIETAIRVELTIRDYFRAEAYVIEFSRTIIHDGEQYRCRFSTEFAKRSACQRCQIAPVGNRLKGSWSACIGPPLTIGIPGRRDDPSPPLSRLREYHNCPAELAYL